MMQDQELQPLLAAVRQGDWDAFETVYRAMSPPLFTVLFRIVGDRAAAEDLLQELFLRIYQAPPDTARRPRAYLFASARHLALDALRRRGADAPLEGVEAACEMDLEGRMDVERALAALPEVERQIVTLHLNAGLKFREAAAVLEMPLGTVLWRYRKAVERLRLQLEGDT
ncbi:MAG: RNA polymerase sigma factor [Oscillospiraceae bacterium]|nr:RNA polymerase sigma factor [Oscillospiraceae bacterium]